MKNKLILIALAAISSLFTACEKNGDNEILQNNDSRQSNITFIINAQSPVTTRATTDINDNYKTTFEEGDAIGIFIVKRANGQALTKNFKYVYQNGSWNPADDNNVAKYPDDNTALDFYAYYPYRVDAIDYTNIHFTVPTDQSDAGKYSAADFMTAKNTTVAPEQIANGVKLQFNHRLALVQTKTKGPLSAGNLEAYLLNCVPEVTVSLKEDGKYTTAGSVSNITMYKVQSKDNVKEYTSWALVPAQTIAPKETLFRFLVMDEFKDTHYNYSTKAETTFAANEVNKFVVTPERNLVRESNMEGLLLGNTLRNAGGTNAVSDAYSGWYYISNSATDKVDFKVVQDAQQGQVLFAKTTDTPSWYKYLLAYNNGSGLTLGKKYKLRFKAKASANLKTIRIILRLPQIPPNTNCLLKVDGDTHGYTDISLNEEWRTYETTFDTEHYATGVGSSALANNQTQAAYLQKYYIGFIPNAQNIDYYIDDVKLTAVE